MRASDVHSARTRCAAPILPATRVRPHHGDDETLMPYAAHVVEITNEPSVTGGLISALPHGCP